MARGVAVAFTAISALSLLIAGGSGVIGGGLGNSSDAVRLNKLSRIRSFLREKGDAAPAAKLRFARPALFIIIHT